MDKVVLMVNSQQIFIYPIPNKEELFHKFKNSKLLSIKDEIKNKILLLFNKNLKNHQNNHHIYIILKIQCKMIIIILVIVIYSQHYLINLN